MILKNTLRTAKTHIKVLLFLRLVFFSILCSFSKFTFSHLFRALLFFNNIITIEFSFLCFNKSGRSSIAATPHIFISTRTSFRSHENENLNIFVRNTERTLWLYNTMRTIMYKYTRMHESWILHRSDII